MPKKLLCQRHPLFYHLSVGEKRLRRRLIWYFNKKSYCRLRSTQKYPYRVKKHSSKLIRKLGDADMQLQYNKVKNLELVIAKMNGTLIFPGETFSFCKIVGKPTRKKGYLMGIELSRGEARPGIGGGICQISNLLNWLVLHSPLEICERHHHSFDPFPDDNRILPFGSGATVFYNYRDFQFFNPTPHTFQINLWLTEKSLEGEIRTQELLNWTYHVYEKEHQFIKKDTQYFRSNEIWREKIDRVSGQRVGVPELMIKNYAEVKYLPFGMAE